MSRFTASPEFDDEPSRSRRAGWDHDEPTTSRERRTPHLVTEEDLPPEGARWSTWDEAMHGPDPLPDWVITEKAAVDHELGVLKTGKEADVHLIERTLPGTDRAVVLAAKRYRTNEHRMFHRDAGYVEGRRVRRSRETRAMANRTAFGRDLLSGQWAGAEFAVLSVLWNLGAPVPYPVQLLGTELLLEYVGDENGAAPRLAGVRDEDFADLWLQCLDAMCLLARAGYAHGDLSAYNLLVHHGRLIVIDLPQAVDIVANPQGQTFLRRDAENVCRWFAAHGVPTDPADVTARLLDEAGMVGPPG